MGALKEVWARHGGAEEGITSCPGLQGAFPEWVAFTGTGKVSKRSLLQRKTNEDIPGRGRRHESLRVLEGRYRALFPPQESTLAPAPLRPQSHLPSRPPTPETNFVGAIRWPLTYSMFMNLGYEQTGSQPSRGLYSRGGRRKETQPERLRGRWMTVT